MTAPRRNSEIQALADQLEALHLDPSRNYLEQLRERGLTPSER